MEDMYCRTGQHGYNQEPQPSRSCTPRPVAPRNESKTGHMDGEHTDRRRRDRRVERRTAGGGVGGGAVGGGRQHHTRPQASGRRHCRAGRTASHCRSISHQGGASRDPSPTRQRDRRSYTAATHKQHSSGQRHVFPTGDTDDQCNAVFALRFRCPLQAKTGRSLSHFQQELNKSVTT